MKRFTIASMATMHSPSYWGVTRETSPVPLQRTCNDGHGLI